MPDGMLTDQIPFREPLSSHRLRLLWGGDTFYAISIKRSASSPVEVDVTSMDSTVTVDPENTERMMIWKEVDTCVVDPGEISCEFWAVTEEMTTLPEALGCKRTLRVNAVDAFGRDTGIALLSYKCFLTKVDLDANVGEYVRGSVTFRLSGYREE